MDWIATNWDAILAVIGGIVTTATAIVQLTPTPKDDAALAKVVKYLQFFSLVKKV